MSWKRAVVVGIGRAIESGLSSAASEFGRRGIEHLTRHWKGGEDEDSEGEKAIDDIANTLADLVERLRGRDE